MKLVWAKEASEDLGRLFDFLLAKSPTAAANAAQGILEKVDLLLEFPELGPRMDDDSGRREFIVPFGAGAHVLRYFVVGDHLVVVRIWHSRELRR